MSPRRYIIDIGLQYLVKYSNKMILYQPSSHLFCQKNIFQRKLKSEPFVVIRFRALETLFKQLALTLFIHMNPSLCHLVFECDLSLLLVSLN